MDNIIDQIKTGTIELLPMLDENGIEIIIAGDLCPDRRIEKIAIEEDEVNLEKLYHNVLPELKKKDLSIANLECPITRNLSPIYKQGPNLAADPRSLKCIQKAQFDVVTLANNHILDQDEQGLLDTIDHCKNAGLRIVGAGVNLDHASDYLLIKVKDITVAILNFAEVEFSTARTDKAGANPLDPIKNFYKINLAKKDADVVIVIVHGGIERYPLPSPGFVETLHFFADLEVAAVIAHHSHFASGLEIYNNVPIFYSLGNFLFDRGQDHSKWHESFFIRLHLTNSQVRKIDLIPYFQFKKVPGLVLMEGNDKQSFLNEIAELSFNIKHHEILLQSFHKLCLQKRIRYMSIANSLNKVQIKLLKHNIGRNLIIKKNTILRLLNTHRCRSHREIMTRALEDQLNSYKIK